MIRLRIDTRQLEGTVDVVSVDAAALATRGRHPDLQPDPRVPSDTRLWAALQAASGGSWAGCVYDVEKISELLKLGRESAGRGN
jgi:hypothetical protein